MAEHTSDCRADELLSLLAGSPTAVAQPVRLQEQAL